MKILGNCALNPFGIILSNSILLYKIDKILSKVIPTEKFEKNKNYYSTSFHV